MTDRVAKVAEVTLFFWIVTIAATTLGETGGDAVTMALGFGYLMGTAIFAIVFVAAVAAQSEGVSSGAVLADDRRDDDRRHDAGGLESRAWDSLHRQRRRAEGRSVLPDHDHVLADARPLGAVLGDALDKPIASGGLAFDRYTASAMLVALIVVCIVIAPQRAAQAKR